MKSVSVLLSTYNGEKYLKEQIDSLICQEDVKVKIMVRDDGSTDKTLQILDEYEDCGYLSVVKGKNIGWKKSFMELLYASSDSDYFAFCDQDDIWLPNKLKEAIASLETLPSQTPNLYGSNFLYYKDGINLGLVRSEAEQYNLHTAMIANIAPGCTMVFNKILRDLVREKRPQIDFPHDYWLYIVASLFGHVIYDHNAYILYRQHDHNQIGTSISKKSIWKKRIENILDLKYPKGRQTAAKELLRLYGDTLPEWEKNIVEKIAYYNRSLKDRLSLLFNSDFSFKSRVSNLGLKIRILLGGL